MRRQVINALVVTSLVLGLSLWIDFFPGSFQRVFGRDVSTRLGLDLQGGTQIFLKPRDPLGADAREKMEVAVGVIERRVNSIGVSESVVQLAGDQSIIVELPGIKDPASATAAIKGAGNLEFIDPRGEPLPDGTEVCTTITPRYPISQTSAPASISSDGTSGISNTTGISNTAGATPTPTAPVSETERACTTPYTTIATGAELDTNLVSLTVDQSGRPAVAFKLLGEAATQMATFTSQNVGRPMSIVLDNVVISSPIIQDRLPGEGIITFGGATDASVQAQSLLTQLKYGALPITLVEDSNRTIGATLGGDSVRDSLVAGVIGMVMIMLFMLFYYRLPGMVANIALLVYTAISFALYKLIPVTLTLPGIAGFILSIGLAVDANVLIFARIKEELLRGRSMARAIEDGFEHAWPSIRDSNAATLITSFILYVFGNSFGVSIIQGFALTLALGIITSLFTAITVSRMLLRLMIDLGVTNPRLFGVDHIDTAAQAEQI